MVFMRRSPADLEVTVACSSTQATADVLNLGDLNTKAILST